MQNTKLTKKEDKDISCWACANRHWTAKQRREYNKWRMEFYVEVDRLVDATRYRYEDIWGLVASLKEKSVSMPHCEK